MNILPHTVHIKMVCAIVRGLCKYLGLQGAIRGQFALKLADITAVQIVYIVKRFLLEYPISMGPFY